MKYAVIRLQGKQYKVSEGEEVLVDKISGQAEPEVLLVVSEDKVSLGKPKVRGASVKVKVLKEEEKGEKLTIQKYKAKSRYRRKMGFRPQYSRLLVEKIAS